MTVRLNDFCSVPQSNEAEYSWASRHTWQSWRERYKKNAVRLDGLISALVEKNRPVQGEKGQYGYVRQAEEKPKRVRKPKKISKTQEQNLERNPYFDSGGEGEGTGPTGLRILRMDVPGGPPVAAPEIFMASQPLMTPEGEPPHPSAEEAEDGDESGTWTVRIGDAPPPTWAKRKASDESEGSSYPKRAKSRFVIIVSVKRSVSIDGHSCTIVINLPPPLRKMES